MRRWRRQEQEPVVTRTALAHRGPRIAIPATKPIHQRSGGVWFADTAQPQPPSPYFYLGEGGGDPILVYLGAVDLVRQERRSSSFFCAGRGEEERAMEKLPYLVLVPHPTPYRLTPRGGAWRGVASTKQTQQKKKNKWRPTQRAKASPSRQRMLRFLDRETCTVLNERPKAKKKIRDHMHTYWTILTWTRKRHTDATQAEAAGGQCIMHHASWSRPTACLGE